MREYQCTRDGVLVTVWDTPGLHDGTDNKDDYVREMVEKCSQNIDLVVYCINSSVTRFVEDPVNPEVQVIATLTNAFGKDIWSKTIIALTFSNVIENFHPNWATLCPSEKAMEYGKVVKKFDKSTRNLLRKYAIVSEDVASEIKIIPTGYYDDLSLHDQENWLSDFWFGCFETIKAAEARAAFYSLNASRIRERETVKEDAFGRDVERRQPVMIPHDSTMSRLLINVAKHSVFGIVALIFAIGALIRRVLFGGVAYFTNTRDKKDSK